MWLFSLDTIHINHRTHHQITYRELNRNERNREITSYAVVFTLFLSEHINIYKYGDRPCVELDTFRDADTHVEGRII